MVLPVIIGKRLSTLLTVVLGDIRLKIRKSDLTLDHLSHSVQRISLAIQVRPFENLALIPSIS